MKRIFHLNTFVITLGLTVLVLFLFLIGVPILDLIELKTYDLRFRSRGLQKAAPEMSPGGLPRLCPTVRWPPFFSMKVWQAGAGIAVNVRERPMRNGMRVDLVRKRCLLE